jgi:hypothetical protein
LSLKAERRRMISNIGGLGELRRFAPFKSCGGFWIRTPVL